MHEKSQQICSREISRKKSLNNRIWEALGPHFGRVWDGLGLHLGAFGSLLAVIWALKIELF